MKNFFAKIACTIVALVAGINTTFAQDAFYIPSTSLNAGSKQTLSVNLSNTDDVTAFQFDISLPAGITVNSMVNEDEETVPDIQLTSRKKSKHQLSCLQQEDGSYRIVVISMSNQALDEHDGAIVNLSVTASSTLTSGSYDVVMSNIHIVPLVNGAQGTRIDQPDYTASINVVNSSQGEDVDAHLSVSTQTLTAGNNNQNLNIALTNNIDITAFQFDVKLPGGITINSYTNEDEETVPNIQLTNRKKSSHQISCNKHEDGSYTVVVISMKNQTLNGTSGDAVSINVNVPITMSGAYNVELSNIHLVPLVNGTPGIRIDQADLSQAITIDNQGGGTPTGSMSFSVEPLTIKPGEEKVLNIDMTNDKSVCSFQFNMKLPEGITIVKEYNEDEEYVEAISLTERKKSSHELNFKQTVDGGYFLLSYSLTNATFKNNSGSIVSIKIKADENMNDGNYGVIISKALLITPDEEKIEQPDYSGTITVSKTSAVKAVNEKDINISILNSTCIIENTQKDDVISIYSMDGKKFKTINSDGGTMKIDVSNIKGQTTIVTVLRNNKIVANNKFTFK